MKRIQPDKPVMVSELWAGQGMRLKIPFAFATTRRQPPSLTNFSWAGMSASTCSTAERRSGWMNGAMRKTSAFAEFRPQISSYDVDALLNEAGDPMPKYFAFREVLLKYNPDAKNIPVPYVEKGKTLRRRF